MAKATVQKSAGTKKPVAYLRATLPAGKAEPTLPALKPLRSHQVDIEKFCEAFNTKTVGMRGLRLKTYVSIYPDSSFRFTVMPPYIPGRSLRRRRTVTLDVEDRVQPSPAIPRLGRKRIQSIVKKYV